MLALGAMVLLFVALAGEREPGRTGGTLSASSGVTAAPADWTPPAGFKLAAADPGVAVRWMEGDDYDCEHGDSCWGIEAVAELGCPSTLYIELSIADAQGTAFGFTTDTAGAARAGQRARFVFETFEKGAQKAQIADVTCS